MKPYRPRVFFSFFPHSYVVAGPAIWKSSLSSLACPPGLDATIRVPRVGRQPQEDLAACGAHELAGKPRRRGGKLVAMEMKASLTVRCSAEGKKRIIEGKA